MFTEIVAPAYSSHSTVRIHLLIADEVVRRGVESLLRTVPFIEEVTVHRGAPEAGRALGEPDQQADAVGRNSVLRVLITTPDDAESWQSLRELIEPSGVKTIILLGDATDLEAAGRVPADGFLVQRQVTASSLAAALDQVVSGIVPMPASLARALLAGGVGGRRRREPTALTSREQETVALLAEGLSNRQIGRRLGLSEHGAKRLVANVMIKLDATNRTAAVAEAMRRGLIPGRTETGAEY
jgi:two-component system, NarL family, nitrate/nitrite response regulator NarL